jgi:L-alanine-DL-glutamate epimerase-like enolase superfamily enzyme
MDYPFVAVEEPIRANRLDEMASLARVLDRPIILDESFVRVGQLETLKSEPSRWLINLRVSKMGGLLRSLQVAAAARDAHIGVICGAQVGETSVLTRAALTVATAAGDTLVAQEGAFGTLLLERDVCDPPLMFGAGGVLDVTRYPSLSGPGFGLAVR